METSCQTGQGNKGTEPGLAGPFSGEKYNRNIVGLGQTEQARLLSTQHQDLFD